MKRDGDNLWRGNKYAAPELSRTRGWSTWYMKADNWSKVVLLEVGRFVVDEDVERIMIQAHIDI